MNNIQWYPGHMTRALRQMKEEIRLVDLVIEILDARIPISSRNPDIDELAGSRFRLIVLNKCDLADSDQLKRWMKYFEEKGYTCTGLDSRKNSGMKNIRSMCFEACKDRIERDRARGIKSRPIRSMVVGIPNVGKSTFINSLAGRASAKTGNKPGVTKGSQWIRVDKQLELLDTPGILWPKFDDQRVARNLALIGSVNDEILSKDELGEYLLEIYRDKNPDILMSRYGGDDIGAVATKMGAISKGSEPDLARAYNALLDDFRSGKLGKICLEVCE